MKRQTSGYLIALVLVLVLLHCFPAHASNSKKRKKKELKRREAAMKAAREATKKKPELKFYRDSRNLLRNISRANIGITIPLGTISDAQVPVKRSFNQPNLPRRPHKHRSKDYTETCDDVFDDSCNSSLDWFSLFIL